MIKKIQIGMLSVSAVLLAVALFYANEARHYSQWSSTQATLEYLSLRRSGGPIVGLESDWGANFAQAEYTYEVDGQRYSGTRVLPLQYVYLPLDKVRSLREGPISIDYDPGQPSQSYIFAVTPAAQLFMLVGGALLLAVIALALPRLFGFFLQAALNERHNAGRDFR